MKMYQDFIETHLIVVALEARKGMLCDVKGILCCSLFTVVSLCCFYL